MANHPTQPADGPTQSQLDQLAAKLEAEYNSAKAWRCTLRLREWDEQYAPSMGYARGQAVTDSD